MTVRHASCNCGALRAACAAEPSKVSLCYCNECQKRTGSAFGVAAFFTTTAVTITGESHSYTRKSDSGFDVTFKFCPSCGSTVFWRAERMPDLVAVAAGAFADPAFPPPQQAVYEGQRPDWLASLALHHLLPDKA